MHGDELHKNLNNAESDPKDLFSQQAKAYAKYRPSYPRELFDYILGFVEEKNCAWDCATGNGQAAVLLSGYFKTVEATDISEVQLQNSVNKPNIHYSVSPAEKTGFASDTFDLVTVAQAYHWLNWKNFHREVTRVGKKNGVVAIWGYNLFISDDAPLDRLLKYFYSDVVGQFWDTERKYVDENYQTVGFDFEPLPAKTFETRLTWTKDDFLGYLSSWSSVQHYINKNKTSPLHLIEKEVDHIWQAGEQKTVRFPIFLRIGRIIK